MNFITFTKLLRTLLLVTALAVGTVGLSGCGDDNGSNSGGGGGGLVCASGDAWVMCNPDDRTNCMGFVFKQNGEFLKVYRPSNGSWEVESSGTYTVNGNKITLIYADGGEYTGVYSISGNTLNFDGKLTKQSGVNPKEI